MPYIPHTPDDLQEMLSVVGVRTLDDLFADIPQDMRPKSFKLPKGQGEASVCAYFEDLAAKNRPEMISFLGAGYYAHQIPKAVDALAGRSEFYTAYTPYQAECSQGTLQAIFEFQTAISRLLDMDCANASVYDGGTALFEAAMMAVRATRRRVLVVDEAVNPIWRVMLGTYMSSLDLELKTVRQRDGVSDMDALMAAVDDNCAAVLVQNPNFFGTVADYTELFAKARAHKAFGIISVYPVMQAVLKTPGEMGADVAVAEAQSLGQPLSFGGPYLGVMTCRKEHIRQFPGRIAGRTTDLDGKTGYVLTLQAREQHIRREKASSNICSNEALCAMTASVYLAAMGPKGLRQAAESSAAHAHYLAGELAKLGFGLRSGDKPFFHEFLTDSPIEPETLCAKLEEQGILGGLPVDGGILWCCTECNSKAEIDRLIKVIGEVLA